MRVTECLFVARAEVLYTELLRDAPVKPGDRGWVTWTAESTTVKAIWEIRENPIWKHGRVFLRCPWCDRRVSRLYIPVLGRPEVFACRPCLGLTGRTRPLELRKSEPRLGSYFHSTAHRIRQSHLANRSASDTQELGATHKNGETSRP